MIGFIILRHVNNTLSDSYWKECYKCIRTYYDNPIIIIDDSSTHCIEDITLINCTVTYDKEHKGAGEILPYYYFHKLKPFDTAVIIHDSVFLQSNIDFHTDTVRFLWTFEQYCNHNIIHLIRELYREWPYEQELSELQEQPLWKGCFGCMSVISWNFLSMICDKHDIFSLLPKIKNREDRQLFERVFAIIVYNNTKHTSYFGDIHSYIKWGITFPEYVTGKYSNYPIMKIWTGR